MTDQWIALSGSGRAGAGCFPIAADTIAAGNARLDGLGWVAIIAVAALAFSRLR
jgi:hypothetical protein